MSARRHAKDKRMKALIAFAERHGWTISVTGGGHLKWRSPDPSTPYVITPSSPSDRRGFLDDRARLRRHGLPKEGSP